MKIFPFSSCNHLIFCPMKNCMCSFISTENMCCAMRSICMYYTQMVWSFHCYLLLWEGVVMGQNRIELILGPGSNLAQAQLFKKGPSLELFGFCVYLVNIWDLERCYGQHSSGSIFWEGLLSLVRVKLMTFKAWDLHTRLCLLKAGRITRKKYLPE